MACASVLDIKDNYAQKIANRLTSFYTEQLLCDFTITTIYQEQTHSVECHRAVLAAASLYFADMLISDGKNNDINFATVQDIHFETVKEVVTFLYKGQCHITEQNVVNLLELGELWCLDELVQDCMHIMQHSVSVHNCVKYYEACLMRDATDDLQNFLSAFILEHFEKLHQANMLKHLSVSGLTRILGDRISMGDGHCRWGNMNNDNIVFDAVLQWSEANPCLSFESVIPLIRYDHMTDDYLLDTVLGSPLLSSADTNRIKHLLKQRLKTGRELKQKLTYASASLPTCAFKKADSFARNNSILRVTQARHLCRLAGDGRRWNIITKLPEWIDSSTASCLYDSQLFFIGGTQGGNAFKTDTNGVHNSYILPGLDVSCAGVAHTGSHIYVSGGGWPASNMSYLIDLSTQPMTWKQCPPMLYGVSYHQSWYYRGQVYIAGGLQSVNQYTRRTQKYNLTTHTWSYGASCPIDIHAYRNRGLLIDNEMHFFLPTLRVMYNCDDDQWSVQPYSYCSGYIEKYTAAVVHDASIVVMMSQEYDEGFTLKRYDAIKHQWSDMDIDVSDTLFRSMIY